ncbi:MAG: hydrogenase maturation nickel metallochaperone HypA [Acidobacteriota bacterium]|nr:hydrogenase maturation nickel metallochaperone HypA [Acidobacteriota bacterium]
MHEYSIIQALMARVESEARKHQAVSVQRIELRIGEQSGVETELLKTAFETFRHGSICSQAEITIELVPAAWSCPACDRTVVAGDVLLCPDCRLPAQLVAGDEIFLDRIEMEAT